MPSVPAFPYSRPSPGGRGFRPVPRARARPRTRSDLRLSPVPFAPISGGRRCWAPLARRTPNTLGALLMRRWTRPTGAVSLALTVAAGALVPLTLAASPAAAIAAPITGVDVSSWQHPTSSAADINWAQVAGAGHDFAIIKATESTTYKNPFYAADIANARAAGLVVGAYHFARPALPLSTAQAQARYFVATTGSMRTARTLPPVLDIEANGGLSKADTVAWAKSFLSTVRTLTGRTPMIYSYDSFLRNSLGNTTALKDYPLWYAKYSTSPPG